MNGSWNISNYKKFILKASTYWVYKKALKVPMTKTLYLSSATVNYVGDPLHLFSIHSLIFVIFCLIFADNSLNQRI